MVKDMKGWKISSRTCKVIVKHSSCAQRKNMKSHVLPTVGEKPNNIALHTETNDLKIMNTHEDVDMRTLDLAVTYKMDANKVLVSGIVPRSDRLEEKASNVNKFLKNECSVRNICFIHGKRMSPRFHCNRNSLYLNH